MTKKSLSIFILFIFVISPVLAANWTEITTKKGIKLFIDDSTISVKDNTVFYWLNFKAGDNSNNKMYMISNCEDNTNGILSTIKTYPNGKVIKDEKDQNNFSMNKVVPDSLSENAHIYACNIISNNTLKWTTLMNNKQKAILNQDFYNAENFLRQAFDEATVLNQNGFGKNYLVRTNLELADFYKNQNRYTDALQLYQNLQYLTQNDEKYNDISSQIPNTIQDLKYKINDEMSRQQQQQETQRQQALDAQRQQQQYQQSNSGSVSDLINSSLNIINRVKNGY